MMQICDKQYQSLNISASPSFAAAQGRENERRGWTKETYDSKNKQPGNRYDWSRKHLNFEVKRGKEVGRINGKPVFASPTIIPLGTQATSLEKRYTERLKELKYKPWAVDAPNQPNTCVDFVLNGDHDRMTEIAFGRPIDFDWNEDNSAVTLADDPDHPGHKQIETLVLDYYNFLCQKFGEENVIGLMCHLDETTPHFHALVIPVAMRETRGRKGGYELNPDVETDGRERPAHIITRQFKRLSEEEQRFYKPAEKKKVPSISYSYFFGESKYQALSSYKQWHTMLYEEVNSKWGLARGEDTSLMTAQDRKDHRKKNKRQLERERLEALAKAEEAKQMASKANGDYDAMLEKLQQARQAEEIVEGNILAGREQEAMLKTQLESASQDLDNIRKEKDKIQTEKTKLEKKVEELASSVGNPEETVVVESFVEKVFAYNSESTGAVIANLKSKGKTSVTMMDVISAAFEEIEKVRARKMGFFDNPKEFRKQCNDDIKSVMTDMQTILRGFATIHKDELTRRSRAIVKHEMRQNAIAIKKIRQYDEMTRMGVTIESYEKVKEKADKYDRAFGVLDAVWPGLWNAVQVITNPRLDKYVMNEQEKEAVRKVFGKKPKERFADANRMINAASTIRHLCNETKAEIYQIAAESAVDYLKRLGLDIAEGVGENVDEVAATAACLFFGLLGEATIISESCGGGGNCPELPRKKDDEDELSFARRCLKMAKTMHVPNKKYRRGR